MDLDAESKLNADKRFEDAFAGIDRSVWTVFKDPNDLRIHIPALMSQRIIR